MTHTWRAIMKKRRASMEAYKKVHNETVISELRMAIVQQSMEMDMWEIKEKLAERREQMAIRAYEEDRRREELNHKIKEWNRREEWNRRAELNQKIEEDKRREAWNQKIEKMINLIESFIQNPISSVKTPQRVATKVPAVTTTVPAKLIQNSPCYDDLTFDRNKKITEKEVGKEGFGCALNKSKGSHLGLRHCAANRKRKKRKGPFVWTKSKSRVVIEVKQTEAIDGGLNCDNRLANYEQPCQHFLMFDYDPQEGELQVKTWDPGITSFAVSEAIIQMLQFHLEMAQSRMKDVTYLYKTDRSFEVGPWVWLKLQPHRQISVRKGKYNKLLPKYYGPFQVVNKVCMVAYKLLLPLSAQIHQVFQVYQLKIFMGDPIAVQLVLPQCDPNRSLMCVPIKVLERKMLLGNWPLI
ncbi:hypothetical protein Tco_1074557 [Tanacetum coccineum]